MLDNEILQIIKHRLVEAYSPEFIYVFGSHAWGNATSQSDIDIAVIIKDSNENPYARPQKGTLALWDIETPIDLLVFTEDEFFSKTDNNLSLQGQIFQKGLIIYEAA
ncbi:MAG: nucleotidyltransferase domain-containing protein [Spirochaetales bacterium]|nr:nucleotidyltransferase domain-containing protein [Spirochaetales bacterium]